MFAKIHPVIVQGIWNSQLESSDRVRFSRFPRSYFAVHFLTCLKLEPPPNLRKLCFIWGSVLSAQLTSLISSGLLSRRELRCKFYDWCLLFFFFQARTVASLGRVVRISHTSRCDHILQAKRRADIWRTSASLEVLSWAKRQDREHERERRLSRSSFSRNRREHNESWPHKKRNSCQRGAWYTIWNCEICTAPRTSS